MRQQQSLQFPCSFPLKVIGSNREDLAEAVKEIFEKHADCRLIDYAKRPSKGDKYLSITVTFIAESREQLDAIYQALNDHELVLMTL